MVAAVQSGYGQDTALDCPGNPPDRVQRRLGEAAMFRVLRRLGQTPPRKLALLVQTFALLLWAKTALAFMPVSKVIARRARPLTRIPVLKRVAQLQEARWAVLVVARYSPVSFVCFPQCLAASELLRRKGIESRLHYGVRRASQTARLETHTWLEADGEIVIGGEVAAEFSTLDVY